MISILHPSRGRARQAHETANKWINNAGVQVEYILSLDRDDDLKTYEYEFGIWFKEWGGKVIVNRNRAVVEATNRAASISRGSILVYLSDDFDCMENWGLKLMQLKYTGEWILKTDDCLQRFGAPIITMPIMSRELYARLGYFWHPDYYSMYVDMDLYYTCKRLGVIKEHPEMKFRHNHYTFQRSAQDDTYRRTESFYPQGRAIFDERRRKAFVV